MMHNLIQPRGHRVSDVITTYQVDDFEIWGHVHTTALGMDPIPVFDDLYRKDMRIAQEGVL